MKKHVAAGLADAMLSGPPAPGSVIALCAAALDSNPPWLRPLARALLRRFDGAWHWGSRRDLIEAILHSDFFANAWHNHPHPRIVRYCLAPPAMAPRPPLLECAVPDLPTAAAVAGWLGMDAGRLGGIIRSLQYREQDQPRRFLHYAYRWVEKRSGGVRLLEIPKARLRELQRRVLHGLLEYVPPHEAAHGFRTGRSCLTHARGHAGQAAVIRMDLEDFFLHIGAARVRALFRALGYPDEAGAWLTAICTSRAPAEILDMGNSTPGLMDSPRPDRTLARRYRSPHLPQGAPTSPALANLCAFRLDVRLQAAADAFGARYTRYADDLVFSGGPAFSRAAERFIPLAGAIAMDEGFAVNFRKTRVMRRGLRQRVTGVVVNERPNVAREEYDRIKAILYNCLKHGPKTQTELPLDAFRNKLSGHVARIGGINPARGERLKGMLDAVRWEEEG
jgi:RNA-directed DNA polymerase